MAAEPAARKSALRPALLGAVSFAASGVLVGFAWKGPAGSVPNPILFLASSALAYALAGGLGCLFLSAALRLRPLGCLRAGFMSVGAAGFLARLLVGFVGLFGAVLLPLLGPPAVAGSRILLYTIAGWFGGGMLERRWPAPLSARAPLALGFGLGEAASGVSTASLSIGASALFLGVAGAALGWAAARSGTAPTLPAPGTGPTQSLPQTR